MAPMPAAVAVTVAERDEVVARD